MAGDVPVGVLGLSIALRDLRDRYGLDSVSATNGLPDGHEITLRWCGEVLEIERDDGEVVLVDTARMAA